MKWVNLEPIKQSEVSLKEKNKYRILTHMMESRKWHCLSHLQGRHRRREQTCEHSWGRRVWDERRKWCWHTYTIMWKTGSRWEAAIYREPSLVLCDDLEGWDWGRGRSSRWRGCMYNYGWFKLLYGRNQYNIVKQFSFN